MACFGDIMYMCVQVIQWFWEVVEEMDNQERSDLMKFYTGTTSHVTILTVVILTGVLCKRVEVHATIND